MHNPISIIFSKKKIIITIIADFYLKFYLDTIYTKYNINVLRFSFFIETKKSTNIYHYCFQKFINLYLPSIYYKV